MASVQSNTPSSSRGMGSCSMKRKRDDVENPTNSAKPKCNCDQSHDLYMLGTIGHSLPVSYEPTNDFQRYDFVRDKWTALVNSTVGVRRTGFAVATRNHEIWVLGGYVEDAGGQAVTDVHMYNTETNGWRREYCMLQARKDFCAAFVSDKLYAIGGRKTRRGRGKKTVEEYADGDWILSSPMTFHRYDFATCVVGNQIIVAGGVSNPSGDAYVYQIEIFGTLSSVWEVVDRTMTFSRKSFTLVYVNDRVYAVGGDAERSVIWNNSSVSGNWSDPITTAPDVSSYDAFALNGEIYMVGKNDDEIGIFVSSDGRIINGLIFNIPIFLGVVVYVSLSFLIRSEEMQKTRNAFDLQVEQIHITEDMF